MFKGDSLLRTPVWTTSAMAAALPDGWLEGLDPVYHIPFYYNSVCKKSTWHPQTK